MNAGLVCLELLKVVQSKQVEAYRNTFANLALPLFAMAEPIAPKVTWQHQALSSLHYFAVLKEKKEKRKEKKSRRC